jgi:hypothetical protein
MEQERLALERLGRAITAVWLLLRVELLLAAVVAQMLLAAQAHPMLVALAVLEPLHL